MARTVLLLGGNLGDVQANIKAAEKLLEQRVGTITGRSSVMESKAWGFESDKRFLNRALAVETALEPEQVLDRVLAIETELGRVRDTNKKGYSSRTMDIDILYYDDVVMEHDRLTIPHPLISEREFVLAPLFEIMPGYKDPRTNKTIAEMLETIKTRTL